MSDLSCPATLIVARHAEAEYESPALPGPGGSLSRHGREQARMLGESLRDRCVAAVWCSDMASSVQSAQIAAAGLGVGVTVRAGLREFSVGDWAGMPAHTDLGPVYLPWVAGDLSAGCPGGETGTDVVRRFDRELQAIADLHCGESVLVVSHGGVMALCLPRLATNLPDGFADGRALPPAATCELAVDADAVTLITWAGVPVASLPADR